MGRCLANDLVRPRGGPARDMQQSQSSCQDVPDTKAFPKTCRCSGLRVAGAETSPQSVSSGPEVPGNCSALTLGWITS